eukprot:1162052-Pelagomonas_calceolata.AAC.3
MSNGCSQPLLDLQLAVVYGNHCPTDTSIRERERADNIDGLYLHTWTNMLVVSSRAKRHTLEVSATPLNPFSKTSNPIGLRVPARQPISAEVHSELARQGFGNPVLFLQRNLPSRCLKAEATGVHGTEQEQWAIIEAPSLHSLRRQGKRSIYLKSQSVLCVAIELRPVKLSFALAPSSSQACCVSVSSAMLFPAGPSVVRCASEGMHKPLHSACGLGAGGRARGVAGRVAVESRRRVQASRSMVDNPLDPH